MNVPQALHCSGCGRALGLEPIAAPDELKCPECRRHFRLFRADAGALHDCEGCGGQFVEHVLLRELLEQREVYGLAAPSRSAANPLDQPVRYRPCPVCQVLMHRRNFGRTSGVIVDVCTQHGIWFDPGELPRVLAFVADGGLVRARKLEEGQRRAAPPPRPGSAAGGIGSFDDESSGGSLIDGAVAVVVNLADAVEALSVWLKDRLGKR